MKENKQKEDKKSIDERIASGELNWRDLYS